MFSYESNRNLIESLIDSIAKGKVRVTKITPESKLFIHQCQYYLELLEQTPFDKYIHSRLDKTVNDLIGLTIQGRCFDWLNGVTQNIQFTEPMNYSLNTKLLLAVETKRDAE